MRGGDRGPGHGLGVASSLATAMASSTVAPRSGSRAAQRYSSIGAVSTSYRSRAVASGSRPARPAPGAAARPAPRTRVGRGRPRRRPRPRATPAGRMPALRPASAARPRSPGRALGEDARHPRVHAGPAASAIEERRVSRTSAWAKRNRSTPSSRTSPATWAGSRTSSTSSSSMPLAAASVGVSNSRPTTAAVRSARTVSSAAGPGAGRPPRTPRSAGRPRPATRRGRTGPRPGARTRPGRTRCRRCARAAPAPAGRDGVPAHAGEHLGRRGGRQPGQLEPDGVPTSQRLGDVGQGAGGLRVRAPGREHQQALLCDGLGQQPQHPQRRGVRPVQVVEHHHGGLRGPPTGPRG